MGENTLTHMIGEIIGRRAEKNMYLGEINKSHFANICFRWTGIFMRYTELCNSQNEKEIQAE